MTRIPIYHDIRLLPIWCKSNGKYSIFINKILYGYEVKDLKIIKLYVPTGISEVISDLNVSKYMNTDTICKIL